ncbi:hypothetical protein PILCRDRAFT_817392 [Piloderma croceum F 1598]|uniref:Uncharacterized protein n=1 Tax=Piloderma croceum (strain F 1598) TaxID=765440 RepID=A0A0C3G025_PILCF|nr:hypothetical protein PILCRDRAFT_817392 [Piloderma croceum F 1598]
MGIPFSFEARKRDTLDVHTVVNDESGKAPVEVPCRKYQRNIGTFCRDPLTCLRRFKSG